MNKYPFAVVGFLMGLFCLSPLAFAFESKSIDTSRLKSEKGDIESQVDLGLNYCMGIGVKRDYKKAFKILSAAAEKGHSDAQYNLGLLYLNGHGVKKNTADAIKWYRKAAEQGNSLAQFNLGVCYDTGEGVPRDEVEAAKWYRKAAEKAERDRKKALKMQAKH